MKGAATFMSKIKKNSSAPTLFSGDRRFQNSDISVYRKFYDGECPDHWHDFFELEIICSGNGSYEVNGRTCEVGGGCGYLVTPEDYHRLCASGMEIYTIAFNATSIEEPVLNLISECDADMVVKFTEDQFEYISKLLEMLDKEYHASYPNRELALKNLLQFLLVCFFRAPELNVKKERKLSNTVMQAVAYIKQNFKSELCLRDVAAAVSVSPNYFGTIFKNEMGCTFNRYLMLTRLRYANNLLQDKNKTVEEIAYASGFASSSYFSESYRKEYGHSPTEMRKTAT